MATIEKIVEDWESKVAACRASRDTSLAACASAPDPLECKAGKLREFISCIEAANDELLDALDEAEA